MVEVLLGRITGRASNVQAQCIKCSAILRRNGAKLHTMVLIHQTVHNLSYLVHERHDLTSYRQHPSHQPTHSPTSTHSLTPQRERTKPTGAICSLAYKLSTFRHCTMSFTSKKLEFEY
eukprot:3068346-Amphidinium_carterae.1